MNELLVILIIVIIIAIGWHIISVRELALSAAKQHCRRMNVQFLDGSVSPNGYGLSRNKNGIIVIKQHFVFEFSSTGERRYQGKALFLGTHLTHIELEPHIQHEVDEATIEIAHDHIKH